MGRKSTFVRTDAVPRTIKDHRLFQNHSSRHIIINTDAEEETGIKSGIGRGHWVTDICYNHSDLY